MSVDLTRDLNVRYRQLTATITQLWPSPYRKYPLSNVHGRKISSRKTDALFRDVFKILCAIIIPPLGTLFSTALHG